MYVDTADAAASVAATVTMLVVAPGMVAAVVAPTVWQGASRMTTWDSSSLLLSSWLLLSVSVLLASSSFSSSFTVALSLLVLSSVPVSSPLLLVVSVIFKSEQRWRRLRTEVVAGPGDVAVQKRAGGAISSPLRANFFSVFLYYNLDGCK